VAMTNDARSSDVTSQRATRRRVPRDRQSHASTNASAVEVGAEPISTD
jgi:hypothetical protein